MADCAGRRRDDVKLGDIPHDPKPGDYWRIVNDEGEPIKAGEPGNLTDGVWGICAPRVGGVATLAKHTVREHDDGTITVAAGDGSSNSILVSGHGPDGELSWHGYIDHGVWREC